MTLKYCLLIILSALLAGCATSPETSAKSGLQARIAQESEGVIALTHFEKTDGQASNYGGIQAYTVDFKATIEYKEECYKLARVMWIYDDFTVRKKPLGGWDAFMGSSGLHIDKGTKVALTGTIDLEKKESGWIIAHVKLLKSEEMKP